MLSEDRKLPREAPIRIPRLQNHIESDPSIIALFLFGSAAKDALQPLSDLDFGVLLDNQLGRKDLREKHWDLMTLFEDILETDHFDLVLMNQAPPRICFEILKTGQLLQASHSKQLTDFIEWTTKIHLDFLPYRQEFDELFIQGSQSHG